MKDQEYMNRSSADFWLKKDFKGHHLKGLALILQNIAAAAAIIERKWSESGAICTQRRGNMSPEQIIIRTMLKANMPLLNKLNTGNL